MQYTVTLVELLFHYRNALNKRPRHLLNFSIFRKIRGGRLKEGGVY